MELENQLIKKDTKIKSIVTAALVLKLAIQMRNDTHAVGKCSEEKDAIIPWHHLR